MVATREKISLWLDETSEPGEATWIVSHEVGDTTRTLATFRQDEPLRAREAAVEYARSKELPLVECDEHGVETPIEV